MPNFSTARNRSARKGGEGREKKKELWHGNAKLEERREREKKNCGNSSAEIDGEKREKNKLNRRGEREAIRFVDCKKNILQEIYVTSFHMHYSSFAK